VSHKNGASVLWTTTVDFVVRVLLFVLSETGINTLRFTYLNAWWHRNCITSHVAKFYFMPLLLRIKYAEFWR